MSMEITSHEIQALYALGTVHLCLTFRMVLSTKKNLVELRMENNHNPKFVDCLKLYGTDVAIPIYNHITIVRTYLC